MTLRRCISVLLLTVSALAMTVSVGASEYLCRHITVDDGLSQSYVTDVVRDGRGFLWVGSRFGLNRYDFANITNYYCDRSDATTLPDNSVSALYVDSRDTLWVAGDRGVAYYSRRNNNFVRVSFDEGSLNARSFYDEGDGLIIGGGGTLYYYDYASGKVSKLLTKGGSKFFYTSIYALKPGLYVLATRWDGLWLYDRPSATISPLPGCPEKHIMAAKVDSEGRLWVSVYRSGVFCYERDASRTHELSAGSGGLGSDLVCDIAEKDGEIWLATDGAGVYIYDPATRKLRSENRDFLGALGSVTRLHVDRHGNIFGGTVRDGAFALRTVAIRTFEPGGGSMRRPSAVTAIVGDDDGSRLWVGTDGNGILVHTEGSDSFIPIEATAGMKITSICPYDSRTLLVSTYDKGIHLLDKAAGTLHPAPQALTALHEANCSTGIGITCSRLSDKRLAVLSDRLSIFNPADGSLTVQDDVPRGILSPFYNSRGLLMFRGSNFIAEYDILTGAMRTLHNRRERINCAAFDGDHTVYIATDTGPEAIDITDGSVTRLDALDIGYVSTLAFEDGHLWLGGNNSLLMRDLRNGTNARFGRYDGVGANEYMPSAALVTNRYVYMGGVNGLVRVDLNDVERFYRPDPEPVISVADLEIDGESAFARIVDGRIEVANPHRNLRLSIIADGTNAMHRPHFRFILSGDGEEQVVESFDNFINIGHLDPGSTYDVSAVAVRPDGSGGSPQHLLTMAVMAPWYNSRLAWLALALLVGASIFLVNRHLRRASRRRLNSQLDAVRHSSLEKEVAFLVHTNYALRTPLTMIYAPIKMLIERVHNGERVDLEGELQNIYRNTKRMRDVIDMAMELHQVGSIPREAAQVRHDMRRSLDETIANHRSEIDNKHLDVAIEAPDDLPDIVLSAPDRMRVALDILMQNAVRRSAEGSSLRISISVADGDTMRVEICDYGPSLDPGSIDSLFHTINVNDNNAPGNSLGLAYAHSIIETFGGRIGAFNNPPARGGITVWMEMPVELSGPDASRRQRPVSATSPDARSHDAALVQVDTSEMTVVVVEEDNDLCMFVSSWLAGHFKRVLHAFNGKDALVIIRQEMPDIVISSILLPFKSGIELCRDIKSSPETRHIPFIMMTTLKEGPQLEDAYGAGADSYISKPFDMNVLMVRMRNLLHTRSVLKQRYSNTAPDERASREMTNADESFLLKIDRLIDENIDNADFNVAALAGQMNMSRTVLYAKFKSITGTTIAAYVNERRLRSAKELLLGTDLSISEISEKLGFSSQRYFSTFFKEHTGMTPSAFRTDAQ